MDKLDEFTALVESIEECAAGIRGEIAIASEKGKFVYSRSKNIRKFSQDIKIASSELRKKSSELFKEQNTK